MINPFSLEVGNSVFYSGKTWKVFYLHRTQQDVEDEYIKIVKIKNGGEVIEINCDELDAIVATEERVKASPLKIEETNMSSLPKWTAIFPHGDRHTFNYLHDLENLETEFTKRYPSHQA